MYVRRPQFIVPSSGHFTWVDRDTGHRTYMPYGVGGGQGFGDIAGMAMDEANDRLLLVDAAASALIAVDLGTGNRLVLSDAIAGSGPALDSPTGLTLDLPNDRVFVTDAGRNAVLSID